MRKFVLLVAAVMVVLAFAAAPAFAAFVERGTFATNALEPGAYPGPPAAGSGSADGQLMDPGSVDVRSSTGSVYVADTGNNRVQVFTATATGGDYAAQVSITAPTGLAVDQSTGEVYVSNAAGVSKFDESLNPVDPSAWDAPTATGALAVDPGTHDLVLADQGANLIRRYSADGTAGGTFAADRPLDLAVDSSGDVIVVTSTGDIMSCAGTSAVERFDAAGVSQGTVGTLDAPGAIAVDPDDDGVVVAAQVNQYTCDTGLNPQVALFGSDGSAGPVLTLAGDGPHYAVVSGLAAAGGSGKVYAVTKSPAGDMYGTTAIHVLENQTPPEATIDPVASGSIDAHAATLTGAVDPNGKATQFHFEYRVGDSGAWTSTADQDAGSGADPVPTGEVRVTGLAGNTEYQVRLAATNADGDVATDPVTFRTGVAAPEVQTLVLTQVQDSAARLRGSVNPNGQATTYSFQYGPTDAYGLSAPAGHTGQAGQGSATVTVTEAIGALVPNTIYHYRLVATNATGTSVGDDRIFTTTVTAATSCPNAAVREQQHATLLADCRAYEQVSPTNKHGYGIDAHTMAVGVSPDGTRVTYGTDYPLPGALAGSYGGWLGERGGDGWTTAGLLPAPSAGQVGLGIPGIDAYLRGSTPDQRVSAYWDTTTEPWGSLGIRRADGSRRRIADATMPPGCPAFPGGGCAGQAWFAGISDDGGHVVFASSNALVPGVASTGNDILYEWIDDGTDDGAGTIRVVNRTNDPAVQLLDPSSAELGGSTPEVNDRQDGPLGLRHAISADGSRIFFQNAAPVTDGVGGGPLYVRENGTTTVELSAPEPGHAAAARVQYLDAAADGSLAFFWADGQLTDDAPVAGGIYRYELQARKLTFYASAPAIGGDPPTAMASDDGRRLYFQNGADISMQDGDTTRLVMRDAVVSSGIFVNSSVTFLPESATFLPGLRDDAAVSANVSADGRYFAFSAQTDLGSGQAIQVYRYDADGDGGQGALRRVSTGPTAPDGRYDALLSSSDSGFSMRPTRSRLMSADGQYVFFNTYVPLVPGDTNGWTDGYEWHDGEVSLVGSGTAPHGSLVKSIDVSARSVFFTTEESLVAQDGDSVMDLYAARVDGGYHVPPPPAGCVGDGCQGASTSPPDLPTAGSITFTGDGNVADPALTKTPAPKLSKMKAIKGTSALLKVKLPAAGTLIASGPGLKKATKKAGKASTVSIRVALTTQAQRTLRKKHTFKTKARVAFQPGRGKPSAVTVPLTFKPATATKKGRS